MKILRRVVLVGIVCVSLALVAFANNNQATHLTAEYNVNLLDEKSIKKHEKIQIDADTNLYISNGGGEEHMLDSNAVTTLRPILTLTDDARMKEIKSYDCSGIVKINKLCPSCDKVMMTVSVLHEVNPKCKHGIFSYANYCVEDDIYVPFVFFTRCGCDLK